MLTYNSARTIRKSLESITNFVNEIVAVDGGSNDGTIEALRSYGALILTRKFTSFDEERNAGLQVAHGKWVFSLDSDEIVPPALIEELRALIEEGAYDVI